MNRPECFRLLWVCSSATIVSCGPPSIQYVPMPVAVPLPPIAKAAPEKPVEPEKLAILPIEDEKLFRAERTLLRAELGAHVQRLLPNHVLVPIADVDAKIRPVSPKTGHPCAYEGKPPERRVEYSGWRHTRILHVSGLEGGPGEQLWVEILNGKATEMTLQGPWIFNGSRLDAYRGAFAAFVKNDSAGVVGGLGLAGNYDNALREGAVTVCETKSFGTCEKSSADWQDRIGAAGTCFAGSDEIELDLLVQGDVGPYCEIENLDYLAGRAIKWETCLCATLGTSAAMAKRSGRRTIRVHYEAPDLLGKPRPELRVVEVTTNLDSEHDWHTMKTTVDGQKQYHSLRRLSVDNLDALSAPLARCSVPAGSVVVADVDIREDGLAIAGHVLSTGLDKPTQTCIEQALGRGAFDCPDDGNAARVRVAMEWPAPRTSPRN